MIPGTILHHPLAHEVSHHLTHIDGAGYGNDGTGATDQPIPRRKPDGSRRFCDRFPATPVPVFPLGISGVILFLEAAGFPLKSSCGFVVVVRIERIVPGLPPREPEFPGCVSACRAQTMMYLRKFALLLLAAALLVSCSGGDSGEVSSVSEPPGNDSATPSNQAFLRSALTGAEITAYSISGAPIAGPVYSRGDAGPEEAGRFELPLDALAPDEWVKVRVSGGVDQGTDAGSAERNHGYFQALATAGRLQAGSVMVTPVSDYAGFAIGDPARYSPGELARRLDALSESLVGDINRDGSVDYDDVLSFVPSRDASRLIPPWDAMLSGPVAAIYAGYNRQDDDLRYRPVDLFVTGSSPHPSIDAYRADIEDATRLMFTIRNHAGDIVELVTEQIWKRISATTILSRNGGGSIGAYGLIVADGRTITIEFPVLDESVMNPDPSRFDHVAIDAQYGNSGEVTATIPKNLMASWSTGDAEVSVNEHRIPVTVLADDPRLGLGIPASWTTRAYVKPVNVSSNVTGNRAITPDRPFFNENTPPGEENRLRYQIVYYADYDPSKAASRTISLTTTLREDDLFKDFIGTDDKSFETGISGQHEDGVNYYVGPAGWYAMDARTAERIEGSVTSVRDIGYFQHGWTPSTRQIYLSPDWRSDAEFFADIDLEDGDITASYHGDRHFNRRILYIPPESN
ncbi:MAG: hypothetical protein U9R74_04655 [Pseudomonadota bacterium]|nr:hypothetical protein [Pseudomonadota bacterium]